jgi:ATP-dependent 26S proteasome regulatory subunit
MSADDLEGDDIWGDGTANVAANGDESKQQDTADVDAAAANNNNNNSTNTNMNSTDVEVLMEDEETRHMSISELRQRIHLISNDIRVMKSDVQRITHESRGQRERIRENIEKVKVNKQLPYLVANVVEILEPDAEDGRCLFRGCCCCCCIMWWLVMIIIIIILY